MNSLELVPASRQSSQLEGRLEDFEQQFVGGCAALVQGFLGKVLENPSPIHIYIWDDDRGIPMYGNPHIQSHEIPMKILGEGLG